MFGKFILLFIMCLGIIYCQTLPPQVTQFTSQGTIFNDPRLSDGSGLTINVYYDSLHQLLRLDYPKINNTVNPGTPVYQIFNYSSATQLQICSTCSSYKLLTAIPIFYQELTDITAPGKSPITNDQGQQCNAWQKQNPVSSGNITTVWTTSTGVPCRAIASDGTTYTFAGVKVGQPASNLFAIPPNANCPSIPLCQAPIDLVLVLDQSGSINITEWSLLLSFADAIVNNFPIGPNKTQVGVVFFSGIDYKPGQDPSVCCGLSDPVLPLNADASTIKKIINFHLQTGGHTCINCGIKSATTYEPNPNRAVQVPKVMVVLTDGFNNRQTLFFATDVQNAKNLGWDMFAIGLKVRNDKELEQIASPPLSSHLLYVAEFSDLKNVVNYVTSSICNDFPNETYCGPTCKGFCICGGQCICPDLCVAPNNCSTAQNVFVDGKCVGCFSTPTVCTSPSTSTDLCKQNACNATTGQCVTQNTVCTPPNTCLTGTCQPSAGCVYTSKCPAQITIPGTNIANACLLGSCNNATGQCTTTPVTCPTLNKCFTSACDPYLGCVNTPVNCDDGNDCTVDVCNNATGCAHTQLDCVAQYKNSPAFKANPAAFNCLTFTCDPKVGCVSTVKTCDDGNLCTTDSCDPSNGNCINTPVVCQQNAADKCSTYTCDSKVGCVRQAAVICNDGLACTNDTCNPATGQCVYTPLVCPPSPNNCSTSVCVESAKQCILQPTLVCTNQVSNPCLSFACDPATKTCKSTATVCNPPDLCSTARCDPVAGCSSTPKTCTDDNPCTIDQCNATTGACQFTPIPGCNNKTTVCPGCTSTDPCNPKVCLNGTCVVTPVICPPNKCATVTPVNVNGACVCNATSALTCPPLSSSQCGENICDPATGKCTPQGGRVCNDNNPCTTDTCTLVSGAPKCTFTAIPCTGDSPCSKKTCVNNNGVAQCIDNPSANLINCTSTSQCATGACNPQTGQCVYTAKNCSNPNSSTCQRAICDAKTGQCVQTTGFSCTPTDSLGCGIHGTCVVINGTQQCSYQPLCPSTDLCMPSNCTPSATGGQGTCSVNPVNCNDNNPCTVNDRCVTSVDANGNPVAKCQYDSYLCPPPTNPCQNSICVNKNGVATCSTTSVNCTAPNNCTTGQCVLQSGQPVCQFTQIKCGTNNICGTYSCDPVKGCQFTSKCDDHNNCTNDICDPKTGNCTYTPVVCNATDVCKTPTCSPTLGCLQNPINCSSFANITALLDPCHFAICAPNNGCQVAVVPNTIDACGFCLKPGACGANRDTGVPPGAIAGAVIGGAVVAGCAAAGIGVFAASRASTGFTPATDNSIVGANTNPLYSQPDTVGNNPFHADNVGDAPYQPLTN